MNEATENKIHDLMKSLDDLALKSEAEFTMKLKTVCLSYAVKSAKVNYDIEGRNLGSDHTQIIEAAKMYYNFVTEKEEVNAS